MELCGIPKSAFMKYSQEINSRFPVITKAYIIDSAGKEIEEKDIDSEYVALCRVLLRTQTGEIDI